MVLYLPISLGDSVFGCSENMQESVNVSAYVYFNKFIT